MHHRHSWKGYPGLSTEEAFDRLFIELTSTLEQYRADYGRNWKEVISSTFSATSNYSILSWCSLIVLCTEFLLILTLYCANYTQAWSKLLPEALVLFILAAFNIGLQVWDNYKRVNELTVKIEKTLEILKELVRNVEWQEENYPDLHMPFSPCITVQWCYRDRKLVNLPWSFLVPGDLISLQPAQKIVAKCQILDENREIILDAGTYYLPNQGKSMTPPPKLHHPLTNQKAIVLESPYVQSVAHFLETMNNKPSTFYSKERHGIINRLIECIVLPVAIMIFIALSLVRLFYLPLWLGIRVAPWSDVILLQPITYTLPLLPLCLPTIWYFLHAIGNAKIHVLFQMAKESEFDCSERFDLRLRRIWCDVISFFFDKDETLHRSQGLLHVLASVTALCCVDKKGILSWPNPTADKIFFLKQNKEKQIEAEVLDITHDNNNAFELHFDDPSWESELSSLKPLGLNVLLNTCNWETRATYAAFHSYITQELFNNPGDELVVPVTGRRCLCEVARIIGFEDKATCCFQLEEELCSFRHIESDEICRDKMHKAKIKFPFPHMMSVVVRERAGMSLQLMAQGTGDLVVDNCEDFWDGQDLRVLTDAERKLVMDFYQRTSLTSICTAFSYKPLSTKVSRKIASLYTELPPSKGMHLWPYYDYINTTKSTDCLLVSSRRESEKNDVEGSVEVQSGQIFLGMITMQYQACMDMVQLIEQLDTACIRFVHFSKENELRSRVFSEKMGLESGWNCHISLSNQDHQDSDDSTTTEEIIRTHHGLSIPSFSITSVDVPPPKACGGGRLNELRRGSSSSVPELIKLSTKFNDDGDGDQLNSERIVRFAESCCKFDARHDSMTPTESCGGDAYERVEHPNTPLGFDMSNRAKLPRGIEQVRPHLENVDNVPLLVSLFTDCTAENATEMIHIMQDYGEVTVVLGSVCNVENRLLFSQADASFGVEPMYPQACQKQQVYVPTFPSPTEVAMLMTSMPCSLFFKRTEQLAFYPLIALARHYMNNCVRNTFQFWCCCQVTLVILGLVATLILLPPLYTLGDSIWVVAVVVPGMSLGLAFSIMDRIEDDVMSRASWKNQWVLDRQMQVVSVLVPLYYQLFQYAFWFYGMKFIPSLVNVTCMAVFNLTWICKSTANVTCSWVYPVPQSSGNSGPASLPMHFVSNWGGDNSDKLLFVQQYSLFFLVLYFVMISSCFVYRSKYLWQKNPLFNRVWLGTSCGIVLAQCFYALIKLRSFSLFGLVPVLSYVWGFLWVILLLALNELLRRQEIKINIRYQKRARLDFGTKLGMNSPF